MKQPQAFNEGLFLAAEASTGKVMLHSMRLSIAFVNGRRPATQDVGPSYVTWGRV